MKYFIRFINIYFLLVFSFNTLSAQEKLYTGSARAKRFYYEAVKQFDKLESAETLKLLKKALKADKNFIEAWFMMAQVYKEAGQIETAMDCFKKGLSINADYYPDGYFILAQIEFSKGLYYEAFVNAGTFKNYNDFRRFSENTVQRFIERCEFAISLTDNPVPFEPVNLGDSINSSKNEYWPSLSLDENKLVFTVLDPVDPSKPIDFGNRQEDFYVSIKNSEGQWTKRKNIGPPVNTMDNEGAQSISADGRYLFFTACNRADGFGMCDIYISENINGKWSVPSNIGSPVNSQYSEKHPSISPDGRTLYFASDRPGGKGGLDIYVSKKMANGNWSYPENLGDNINTQGDEQSPFIHPDGKTLYFSSEGHMNLGRGDIFMSKLKDNGEWSHPLNLGYPINTCNNELGLIVNSAGDLAYYASDRLSGNDLDIYQFVLHPEARPDPVSYIKGRIFDSLTYKGLESKFQLIDLSSGGIVIESISEPETGDFLLPLPTGKNYALNVSRSDYLFYSDHFAFEGIYERTKPFLKDIALQGIHPGNKIVLNNIFFEFDKYDLKKESEIELKKILDFLNVNPDIKVRINGHTDNIGSEAYNKTLSEKRSESVVNWLINNGIDETRLSLKGYGPSLPLESNDTEEGRAKNRRTELQIIE